MAEEPETRRARRRAERSQQPSAAGEPDAQVVRASAADGQAGPGREAGTGHEAAPGPEAGAEDGAPVIRAGSTSTAGLPSRRELRESFDPAELSRGLARYANVLRWGLVASFAAFIALAGAFAYWWTLWTVAGVVLILLILWAALYVAARPARDPVRPIVDPIKNRIDRWAIIPWIGFGVSIVFVSLKSNALEDGGAGLWALVPLVFLVLTLLPDALFVRTLNRMSYDAEIAAGGREAVEGERSRPR